MHHLIYAENIFVYHHITLVTFCCKSKMHAMFLSSTLFQSNIILLYSPGGEHNTTSTTSKIKIDCPRSGAIKQRKTRLAIGLGIGKCTKWLISFVDWPNLVKSILTSWWIGKANNQNKNNEYRPKITPHHGANLLFCIFKYKSV